MNGLVHRNIAKASLEYIQSNIDWDINRKAYIFGSIAPDINYVYPAHNIKATYNRFIRRLKRMDRSNSVLIKSFTLGVISHYICDYFCMAHNIHSYGPRHKLYEVYMTKHIKNHEINIKDNSLDIESEWNQLQEHLISEYKENDTIEHFLINISKSSQDHIEYIANSVLGMHDNYIKNLEYSKKSYWYQSIDKMSRDIEYATFMCNQIMMLILKPSLSIQGNEEVYVKHEYAYG